MNKFEIGEKVIVIKKCGDTNLTWLDDMDKYLNKEFIIDSIYHEKYYLMMNNSKYYFLAESLISSRKIKLMKILDNEEK